MLYGFHNCRGTGTAIVETKLAQEIAFMEQEPWFMAFIDLKKAFDAMDRGCFLEILQGYSVGPNMF